MLKYFSDRKATYDEHSNENLVNNSKYFQTEFSSTRVCSSVAYTIVMLSSDLNIAIKDSYIFNAGFTENAYMSVSEVFSNYSYLNFKSFSG